MLFHVKMDVHIPFDADPARIEALKASEKARAADLQRSGVWRHLWRIVGEYSNISIFDVPDGATLHGILSTLPLFPLMKVKVTPLCRHPSSIHDDDR